MQTLPQTLTVKVSKFMSFCSLMTQDILIICGNKDFCKMYGISVILDSGAVSKSRGKGNSIGKNLGDNL